MHKKLSEYNGIVKENEKIYRDVARNLGLSDSAFWILYSLQEMDGEITQKDIVNDNYLPPQTINSALKKLEKHGYVELRNVSDKRSKSVYLTKRGKLLAQCTVDRVIAAELKTVESLTEEEQEIFFRLFHKYTAFLKKNISSIEKENSTIEQL